jgi:hypothetical protein
MPGMACRLVAGTVVMAAALAGSAGAQGAAVCTVGSRDYFNYGPLNQTGAPFSATVKSTFEQKLPDGNSIRGFARSRQARDSLGKTMSEMVQSCTLGEDGQPHESLRVSVYNPVAKTDTIWEAGGADPKVARVYHRAQPAPSRTPGEQAKIREQRAAFQMYQPPLRESKTEDLGMKTINGVSAKGSRQVRTIPVGEEGNELPLEIVSETWQSQELGLLVLSSSDDPRSGRRTSELEELNRGEPDPALFMPPADYKVEEIHANQAQ